MTVRYLVISDIHGNLEALDTVLTVVEGRYDKVLVLGDLVGYGADPNAVIDRVRGLEPTLRDQRQPRQGRRGPGRRRELQFGGAKRGAVDYEALTPANREYLDEVARRTAGRRRPPGDLSRDAL